MRTKIEYINNDHVELTKLIRDIDRHIEQESIRQIRHAEMIASENYTYGDVLRAQGSILTNKYAEGYPGARYYGGCEHVDMIENKAIELCCQLFKCRYANVQPHSGSQANMAAFMALMKPGDKVLGMSLNCGGHLTHGYKASASGKFYEAYSYGVGEDGYIDYDEVLKIAKEVHPKVIVCGASAYPRTIDFKKFREIADEVGAYLMADIAHIAGLVVTGEHPSPFPFAHVVTSTTHKTLRGPRGGIIMTNSDELIKKINSALFPGIQGGPLMHIIAAKAMGFAHNLSIDYVEYIKNVKENIKVLEQVFKENNIKMVTGGSDNHLLLLDFSDDEITGADVERALGEANITTNKNTVPNEKRSPMVTSGLRLGTAALTARGCNTNDMKELGSIISSIIVNLKTDKKIASAASEALKERVIRLISRKPIIS